MRLKTELATFQRNEALVLTDNSDKFAEWPTVTIDKKNEVVHKIGNSITSNFIKKTSSLNATAKALPTSRAPLVQQRAAILRNNSRISKDTTTVATSLPIMDVVLTAKVGAVNEDPIDIEKIAIAAPSNESTAMMVLLQQAEGLLTEVNAVRSRTNQKLLLPSGGTFLESTLYSNFDYHNPVAQELAKPSVGGFLTNFKNNNNIGFSMTSNNHLFGEARAEMQRTDFGEENNDCGDWFESVQLSKYSEGVGLVSRNNPTSTLTQLDWLLRGLPEAYDDDDDDDDLDNYLRGGPLDDLAVEKLIKEGGKPPSQLVFPSLYSMGQQIMSRLQRAKCLAITLNHMIVYSSRYGIRRHCSRLLIRPPGGCITPENESEVIILDLPELLGRDLRKVRQHGNSTDEDRRKIASRSKPFDVNCTKNNSYGLGEGGGKPLRKRAAVGVGPEAFFVGGIELQRTILLPLDTVTDKILQVWLRGGKEGCVCIELQGHITPPFTGISSSAKQERRIGSEFQVFGRVDIPLGGLLGTESLDASVTCELEVDKNTLASVIARAHLLPLAGRHSGSDKLGPKLGNITARLTLLGDTCPENNVGTGTGEFAELCEADRTDAQHSTGVAFSNKKMIRGEVKHRTIMGHCLDRAPLTLLTQVQTVGESRTTTAALAATRSTDVHVSEKALTMNVTRECQLGTHGGEHIEDPLHSAMSFVPTEAPCNKARSALSACDVNSSERQVAVQATMGVVVRGLLGIDVGALQPSSPSFRTPSQREASVLLSRVTVAYKPSPVDREQIHGPWTLSNSAEASGYRGSQEHGISEEQEQESWSQEDLQYHVNSARLHTVSMDGWKAPVLEVWVEWGFTTSPRDRDRDRSSGRTRSLDPHSESLYSDIVPVISRQLLGLARYPPQYQFDHTAWLPVSLLALEDRVLGNVLLVASLHLGDERKQAEKLILEALSPYSEWNEPPPGVESASVNQRTLPVHPLNEDKLGRGKFGKGKGGNFEGNDEEVKKIVSTSNFLASSLSPSVDSHASILGTSECPSRSDSPDLMVSSDLSLIEKGELSASLKKEKHTSKDGNVGEVLSGIDYPIDAEEDRIATLAMSSGLEKGHREGAPAHDFEVHLLDLSLEGSSFPLAKVPSITDPYGFLGCFVLYSFPDIAKQRGVEKMEDGSDLEQSAASVMTKFVEKGETHHLWWDAECTVLNGRVRHTFECPPLTHQNAPQSGIIFSLASADLEGCLPSPRDRTIFATCHLPIETLWEVISKCVTMTVALPLIFTMDQVTYTGLPLIEGIKTSNSFSASAVQPTLSLTLSHRLQPVLYRSIDMCASTHLPVDKTSVAPTVPILVDHTSTSLAVKECSLDPLDALSPYEKLKRGLFSWDQVQKKTSHPPSALPSVNPVSERSTQELLVGMREIVGDNGVACPNPNPGMVAGVSIRVTVTRVSNWSRSLLSEFYMNQSIVSSPTPSSSSSPPSSEVMSQENEMKRGQATFMFCVVESNVPQREEWHFGRSKYVPSHTELFTTGLKPLLPQTQSSLDDCERSNLLYERRLKDVTWDESKQMFIPGAVERNKEDVVGNKGCALQGLALLKGAFLTVSVYVRRVWHLSDSITTFTSKSVSQDGEASFNTLHIGDQLVGSTVIDLSTLAVGMREVSGWYHLVNATHHTAGQIFFTAALPLVESTDVRCETRSGGALLGLSDLSTFPSPKNQELSDDNDNDDNKNDVENNVEEDDAEEDDDAVHEKKKTVDSPAREEKGREEHEEHESRGEKGNQRRKKEEKEEDDTSEDIEEGEETAGQAQNRLWGIEVVRKEKDKSKNKDENRGCSGDQSVDWRSEQYLPLVVDNVCEKSGGEDEKEREEQSADSVHRIDHCCSSSMMDIIIGSESNCLPQTEAGFGIGGDSFADIDKPAEYSSADIDESTEQSSADIHESAERSSTDMNESAEYSVADIDIPAEYTSADIDESAEYSVADIDIPAEYTSADIDESAEYSFADIDESAELSFAYIDESTEYSSAYIDGSSEYSSADIDESTNEPDSSSSERIFVAVSGVQKEALYDENEKEDWCFRVECDERVQGEEQSVKDDARRALDHSLSLHGAVDYLDLDELSEGSKCFIKEEEQEQEQEHKHRGGDKTRRIFSDTGAVSDQYQQDIGAEIGSDNGTYSLDFEEEVEDYNEEEVHKRKLLFDIEENMGNTIEIERQAEISGKCQNKLPMAAESSETPCFDISTNHANDSSMEVSPLLENELSTAKYRHDDSPIGAALCSSPDREVGHADVGVESKADDKKPSVCSAESSVLGLAVSEIDRIRQLVDREVSRIVSEKYPLLSLSPSAEPTCDIPGAVSSNLSHTGGDLMIRPGNLAVTTSTRRLLSTTCGGTDEVGRGKRSEPSTFIDADPHFRLQETEGESHRTRGRHISFSADEYPTKRTALSPLAIGDVIARALSSVKKAKELADGKGMRSDQKYPGRQKQFLDAETERVSRIMLRTMQPESQLT